MESQDAAEVTDSVAVPDWVHDLAPLERPLAIIDLEATGVAPHHDRIVEVAVLKVLPDGRKISKTRRVNPVVPIPKEATEVHGIRNEDLEGEPEFRHLALSLAEFLEDCDLAGFGIVQFDLPMLRAEFRRADVEFSIEGRRILDAKAIYHHKEPRTLGAAHVHYCGGAFEAAHTAEADVFATYRVLLAQLRRYDDLPRDFEDLHKLSNPRQADFVDTEGRLVWRGSEIHFNFGKHRGAPVREICVADPDYVTWLIDKDFPADLQAILADALEGRFPIRIKRSRLKSAKPSEQNPVSQP